MTLLTGDLTSLNSVSNILRNANPDLVFHLGALSPVRYSFEHPFQYQEANYIGTLNLAHSLMELGDFKKRRLLVASTAEVYGIQAAQPFKEDFPLRPTSPYAVSKASMDMYLRMAARVYDLNCVIMRPANTYGRKREKGFIVEYLVTSMLAGQRVYVGAPNSVRDYIHVDDHVRAYVLAAERASAQGHVFNIGSGVGISNRDLALLCSRILDSDATNIVFGSYPPGYPMRPLISDQPYIVLDSTRAREELGWRPRVRLEEGLQMVVDYWKGKV
jgi:UDP-glucose 4-epimerase